MDTVDHRWSHVVLLAATDGHRKAREGERGGERGQITEEIVREHAFSHHDGYAERRTPHGEPGDLPDPLAQHDPAEHRGQKRRRAQQKQGIGNGGVGDGEDEADECAGEKEPGNNAGNACAPQCG
jgi:hypothetical protein